MKRRITQFMAFIFLNTGAWLQLKWLCPQMMYCHACPASVFACPIGVIGYYCSFALVPVFALGLIFLIASLVGRFLCGWICPFGLLQDLLYKLPVRKIVLPGWTLAVKYVILVVMVFFVAGFIGQDSIFYYCRTCPVSTATAVIPIAIRDGAIKTDAVTIFRLFFLFGVLVLCSMASRAYCRVLCPVGALVAPLNEAAALSVKIDESTCIDCGACARVCSMGLEPTKLRGARKSGFQTRSECVSCTECVDICPKDSLKLGI